MTTKPPSTVKKGPEASLEKIAYACVEGIPAQDPHDLDRLGYSVWLWLALKRDSLEHAVQSAGANLLVSQEEAVKTIQDRLRQQGVAMPS